MSTASTAKKETQQHAAVGLMSRLDALMLETLNRQGKKTPVRGERSRMKKKKVELRSRQADVNENFEFFFACS